MPSVPSRVPGRNPPLLVLSVPSLVPPRITGPNLSTTRTSLRPSGSSCSNLGKNVQVHVGIYVTATLLFHFDIPA